MEPHAPFLNISLSKGHRGARFLDVRIRLGKIARVDHRKLLALDDAAAKLDLELDDAAGDRRHHFHGAGRICLEGGGQCQGARDLFHRRRSDGEQCPQGRRLGAQ